RSAWTGTTTAATPSPIPTRRPRSGGRATWSSRSGTSHTAGSLPNLRHRESPRRKAGRIRPRLPLGSQSVPSFRVSGALGNAAPRVGAGVCVRAPSVSEGRPLADARGSEKRRPRGLRSGSPALLFPRRDQHRWCLDLRQHLDLVEALDKRGVETEVILPEVAEQRRIAHRLDQALINGRVDAARFLDLLRNGLAVLRHWFHLALGVTPAVPERVSRQSKDSFLEVERVRDDLSVIADNVGVERPSPLQGLHPLKHMSQRLAVGIDEGAIFSGAEQ